MAHVVLIRHGETDWSKVGRHTGVSDLALTPTGESQARRLAAALHGESFDLVLTSPRQRATTTARLAQLTGPRVDDDLAEWDYGGYEGLTTSEINARLGRSWTVFADGVPAGETPGETLQQVAARADRVLDRIQPVLQAGGNVAVVGHGHHLRVLAARWLSLPPVAGALLRLDAATLSRLGYEHAMRVILLWNARPELPLSQPTDPR